MSERIPAGFRFLYYGAINSSGIFTGSSNTAPTAGSATGSIMARLQGARTLPVNIPEPETVVADGDDQPLVNFEFDAAELVNGLLETAVRNDAFEAFAQGTLVETSGNMNLSPLDPTNRSSQSMNLLMWRRSKSWAAGERGAKKWQGLYIHICSVKPLGNAWEQRVFNGLGYAVNVSRSDRLGWTTVNNTEHGTTGASLWMLESDNPMMLERFTGNNSQQSFTLTYALVSGGTARVFVDDVEQAITTDWTISGSTLTFVGTPGSNAVIQVIWEVDESVLG